MTEMMPPPPPPQTESLRALPTLPRLRDAVRAALGRGDASALRALDAQLAQWTSALTVHSCDAMMTAHLLKLRALVLLKLEAYEFSCHALTLAAHVLSGDAPLWGALSIALTRLGDHAEAARAVTHAYAVCRDDDHDGSSNELRARLDRMLRGGDPCAAV